MAHAALRDGALGRVFWAGAVCASYLPDWRSGRDHRRGYAADPVSGGVLLDVIHEFDLAAHLLGPCETVHAVARSAGQLGIASEDVADALLRHESGVVTSLHLDYLTRPPLRVVDIAGENGRIAVDISRRRFTRWRADGTPVSDETFAPTFDDDYRREIARFLDCIAGKARPRCEAREALAVLANALKARALAGLPAAGAGNSEGKGI